MGDNSQGKKKPRPKCKVCPHGREWKEQKKCGLYQGQMQCVGLFFRLNLLKSAKRGPPDKPHAFLFAPFLYVAAWRIPSTKTQTPSVSDKELVTHTGGESDRWRVPPPEEQQTLTFGDPWVHAPPCALRRRHRTESFDRRRTRACEDRPQHYRSPRHQDAVCQAAKTQSTVNDTTVLGRAKEG